MKWKTKDIKNMVEYMGIYLKKNIFNVINNNKHYYNSIYEGRRPVLRVGEPELIKNITVRDFHIFVNRRDIHLGEPVFDRALTVVRGEDWKQLRSVVCIDCGLIYSLV